METTECLTPPCSSESKSDEVQSKEVANSHAQFLKSSKFGWIYNTVFINVSLKKVHVVTKILPKSLPPYIVWYLVLICIMLKQLMVQSYEKNRLSTVDFMTNLKPFKNAFLIRFQFLNISPSRDIHLSTGVN